MSDKPQYSKIPLYYHPVTGEQVCALNIEEGQCCPALGVKSFGTKEVCRLGYEVLINRDYVDGHFSYPYPYKTTVSSMQCPLTKYIKKKEPC